MENEKFLPGIPEQFALSIVSQIGSAGQLSADDVTKSKETTQFEMGLGVTCQPKYHQIHKNWVGYDPKMTIQTDKKTRGRYRAGTSAAPVRNRGGIPNPTPPICSIYRTRPTHTASVWRCREGCKD